MSGRVSLFVFLIASAALGGTAANDPNVLDPAYRHASPEAYERWRDLKYGLRIHWGYYSLLGVEASWAVRKMPNEKKQEYFDLYRKFNPTAFDANEWMDLLERNGLRFFTITTKHHDGFSLFDTKTRVKRRVNYAAPGGPKAEDCDLAYSVTDTPLRRDIIKELTEAAHKRGIAVDLYFSHIDWYDADFRMDPLHPFHDKGYNKATDPEGYARFARRHREQIRELLTSYGKVDMMCLDMSLPGFCWPDIRETVLLARKLQPDVLLRDRGIGAYGDYTTPENWIPASEGLTDKRVTRPWMVIHTLSGQFAYDPNGAAYRSGEWIVSSLIDIVAKGGNFMVSIGPDGTGKFHPAAVEKLDYAGRWLKVNGEAIYGTRPWVRYKEGENVRFTRSRDGKHIYGISLRWPGERLVLRSVRARDGSQIRLLGVEKPLSWRNDEREGLVIELPNELQTEANRPCKQAYAFRIEADSKLLELDLQRRDAKTGEPIVTKQKLDPAKMGVVLVDWWNFHWCKTAAERVACLTPRINRALDGARALGMQVFLCPTDVADSYAGTPQRERAVAASLAPVPKPLDLSFPGPRGGGCMCGPGFPCVTNYGWDGMDPHLRIDERDLVAEGTQQLYSLCRERGITHLLYMGVHTNMCVMGKSVGMVPLMRTGLQCILCRDLTDACTEYNPARGYTPDQGTAEVVAHLERHVLPTVHMVTELRKAGLWSDEWVVDPVRVTPWGRRSRPHQFEGSVTVTLTAPWSEGAEIRYTLDGSEPSEKSELYAKPLVFDKATLLRAIAFKGGRKVCLESEGCFVRLPERPLLPEVHLPDLKPLRATGGFEGRRTVPNRSYADTDLKIRGVKYAKGMGVHAPSELLYEVKPEFLRFVALAGIDDSIRDANMGREQAMYPSVVFRVFLDGKLAAESPVMRVSQEPWRFNVEIPKGSRTIALTTTDAGDGNRHDLADWVSAGFLCEGWEKRATAIPVPGYWEHDPRFAGYDGFAWYRCYIKAPDAWKGKDVSLAIVGVDNCHEAFFNGEKVGSSGTMPPHYTNGLDTPNRCTVPAKLARPGQWNLLAIRVYDAGGAGGFRDDAPVLSCGNEAIELKGKWEFRTGDDPSLAKWPTGSEPPPVARFDQLTTASPKPAK